MILPKSSSYIVFLESAKTIRQLIKTKKSYGRGVVYYLDTLQDAFSLHPLNLQWFFRNSLLSLNIREENLLTCHHLQKIKESKIKMIMRVVSGH